MRNTRDLLRRLFPVLGVAVLALGFAVYPGSESQGALEDEKKDPAAVPYKPVVEVDVVMHGVDDVFEAIGEMGNQNHVYEVALAQRDAALYQERFHHLHAVVAAANAGLIGGDGYPDPFA